MKKPVTAYMSDYAILVVKPQQCIGVCLPIYLSAKLELCRAK